MWGSVKLLLILLLTVGSYGQVPAAESKDTKFYLYPETVEKYNRVVIFTGKLETPKHSEVELILASCSSWSYMVVSATFPNGKEVVYKSPKKLTAYKNSALDIILTGLCQETL